MSTIASLDPNLLANATASSPSYKAAFGCRGGQKKSDGGGCAAKQIRLNVAVGRIGQMRDRKERDKETKQKIVTS